MLGTVYSAALFGIDAKLVHVEVDMVYGLPSFDMVGLLSSEVREAKERVRSALRNSGFSLPPMKITVNLSPADLRKQGNAFDLPIAIAILTAMEVLDCQKVSHMLFIGELSLDGRIRPANGVLSVIDLLNHTQNLDAAAVPYENIEEARSIIEQQKHLYSSPTLSELIVSLMNESYIDMNHLDSLSSIQTKEDCKNYTPDASASLDFSDISGQESVKRAALIAAAGMHNILLNGSPGTSKSMIARRIPTILPPMTKDEQIELTKIYSAGGTLVPGSGLIKQRPFRALHHSISAKALSGGGTIPVPGEISYADRGVLFLDELAEFKKETLEVLRQPMEDGMIRISRIHGNYEFPAHFMLAAATNPCPCGYYPDLERCRCTPTQIRLYTGRISGPLLDRIDICITTPSLSYKDFHDAEPGMDSKQMARKVQIAHEIQLERYKHEPYLLFNSQLSGQAQMKQYCPLPASSDKLMEHAFSQYRLSARSYHKIIKVARTIADLEEASSISEKHLIEALNYRTISTSGIEYDH